MGTDVRKKRLFVYILLALASVQAVYANGIVTMLERFNIFTIYTKLAPAVDFFIFFAIFWTVATFALGKRYAGTNVRPMLVSIGIALAGGGTYYLHKAPLSTNLFTILGGYAAVLFVIVLVMLLYYGFVNARNVPWPIEVTLFIIMLMIIFLEAFLPELLGNPGGSLIQALAKQEMAYTLYEFARGIAILLGIYGAIMLAIRMFTRTTEIGTEGGIGGGDEETSEAVELRGALGEQQRELAKVRGDLARAQKERETLAKQYHDERQKTAQLKDQKFASDEERADAYKKQQLAESEAAHKIEAKDTEVATLEHEKLDLANKLEAKSTDLQAASGKVKDLIHEVGAGNQTIDNLREQHLHEKNKIHDKALNIVKNEDKTLEEEIDDLTKVIHTLETQHEFPAVLDKVKDEIKKLNTESKTTNQQIFELTHLVDVLRQHELVGEKAVVDFHRDLDKVVPYAQKLMNHIMHDFQGDDAQLKAIAKHFEDIVNHVEKLRKAYADEAQLLADAFQGNLTTLNAFQRNYLQGLKVATELLSAGRIEGNDGAIRYFKECQTIKRQERDLVKKLIALEKLEKVNFDQEYTEEKKLKQLFYSLRRLEQKQNTVRTKYKFGQ